MSNVALSEKDTTVVDLKIPFAVGKAIAHFCAEKGFVPDKIEYSKTEPVTESVVVEDQWGVGVRERTTIVWTVRLSFFGFAYVDYKVTHKWDLDAAWDDVPSETFDVIKIN